MLLNYEGLFVLVCISVFTLAATSSSILLGRVHLWLQRTTAQQPARQRARLWMAVGFLPTVAATIATTSVASAFARYEPRHTSEETGFVLMGIAAAAGLLVAGAAWRLARTIWNTARCHRLVNQLGDRIHLPSFPLPAWRIPVDFPLAAVSGIVKPRLILSSRILDECSSDELAAVLRHEAAHARHHDNLVRACLLACPDTLGGTGRKLVKEWHHAVEEAADEEASGSDTAARVTLAAALVRVSRMSTEGCPAWMPALALYDGHTLEDRVRRLLQPDSRQIVSPQSLGLRIAGAVMIAAALWLATGPRLLHVLMEWGIRNLP